ncbi:Helix-turn-helix domain-containing protein [Chitinophaga costaii]|uniref:Helix-turn-helix domain-containing protein n=1 Tax=Chitinophaga costaii TaxID=1335309 RepID=A0A1C4DF91_9BACT|nr:AraC family transcriptional regulator [Chitinophaga costaii]PUZ24605.1 hypothetical protein DCM91_11975 [Chitinophaga costaii]SCC30029.1 Helix-turn-helix domain-containing protein [Chitinophaga costaii]
MRFQIADSPGALELSALPVPENYQKFVYKFAEPQYIAHPQVDIILQETKVHDFVIASHVIVVKEAVMLLSKVAKTDCMLFSMLKGAIECSLPGFPQPVWFMQGQYFLLCVNKGAYRTYLEPGIYQSFYVTVPASFLTEITPVEDPILSITRHANQSAALTGNLWYPLYESIDELRNNTARSAVHDQRLVNIIEQMLLLVIDRKRGFGHNDSRSIIDESVLVSVQHYINFHLQEPLNLQALARRFNLQPLELQEMFLRRSQATIEEFVFGHRMELARQLMLHSKMPIGEIMEETGFTRRAVFSKAYKECFKEFPMDSRRPWKRVNRKK